MRRLARRVVGGILRFAAGHADVITTVNDSVVEEFRAEASKTFILNNTPTRAFAAKLREARAGIISDSARITMMHGKATKHHGTQAAIDSLSIVVKRGINCELVVFKYFGKSSAWHDEGSFHDYLSSLDLLESVKLLELRPYEDMPTTFAGVDIGLIAYNRSAGRLSLPNRFFEYMAAGIPMIVPDYANEIRPLVEANDIGLAVNTEDPTAVAAAFEQLASDQSARERMGRHAATLFDQGYSWDVQFGPVREKILELLHE